MRRVAAFADHDLAERLADYLQARGLPCRADVNGQESSVWVFDEDRIEDARGIVDAVQSGALHLPPRRPPVPAVADPLPRRRIRHTWGRRLGQSFQTPCTSLLLLTALIVTVLIDFGDKIEPVGRWLSIIPFQRVGTDRMLIEQPDSLLAVIRSGEVWRLVTPIFLHFHVLHLLFNMQWNYVFGGAIERVRGSWRLAGLILFSAVASNVAQYAWSGPAFGGLSGVGHAMFGYVWMKFRFQPELGLMIPRSLFWLFWGWFLLCFTDLVGPIANLAHTVGLAAGILYGLARFL